MRTLRPTAIIGLSGQPQTFTKEVLETMGEINERPIIFALSNPTSMAECTAEQAYTWTEGRAVFVTDEMFLAAAHSLANQVTEADLRRGRIYPPLSCIREVSAKIAAEVATIAYDNGYTDKEKPADVLADIRENMYHPVYPHYV